MDIRVKFGYSRSSGFLDIRRVNFFFVEWTNMDEAYPMCAKRLVPPKIQQHSPSFGMRRNIWKILKRNSVFLTNSLNHNRVGINLARRWRWALRLCLRILLFVIVRFRIGDNRENNGKNRFDEIQLGDRLSEKKTKENYLKETATAAEGHHFCHGQSLN